MTEKPVKVRKVFAEDLEYEFYLIKSASSRYSFVSIDTEFPGTIFKPSKQVISQSNPFVNYHYMKSNVDAFEIIQIGLSLSDAQGNLPDFGMSCSYVWEFNFKDFDIDRDLYVSDSIELLKQQGIDFAKNKEKGIDSKDFADMLWKSGMVNNLFGFKGITWITFHGTYDFGFMVKILTKTVLPADLQTFMDRMVYFFRYNVFDLKHTSKFFGMLGGLENVAQILDVPRVAGSNHQAGSDSLLTLQCFMKFKKSKVFNCNLSQRNIMLPPLALYGLIQGMP